MAESKFLGLLWFITTLAFWLYYTMWIVISPFVEPSHSLQRYFPDRKWGIVIPILLGIGFLCIALTLVGLALLSDSKIYEKIRRSEGSLQIKD